MEEDLNNSPPNSRLGIACLAYGSCWFETFADLISVSYDKFDSQYDVLSAARDRTNNWVLLTNFPSDDSWRKTLQFIDRRRVDDLVARKHPDEKTRLLAAMGAEVNCATYEWIKDFYGRLLRDFPNISLNVMTFAKPTDVTDQEIISLAAPGRIHVTRRQALEFRDDVRKVIEILDRHEIHWAPTEMLLMMQSKPPLSQ